MAMFHNYISSHLIRRVVAAGLGYQRSNVFSSCPKLLSSQSGLDACDGELAALLHREERRQNDVINLIASENYVSRAVRDALGSCIINKYAEGAPGARYYPGCQLADEVEELCENRALEAFRLAAKDWGVNVQPYSGSPANLIVYTALLQPRDRILSMNTEAGGHASHGLMVGQQRLSGTSKFFEPFGYGLKADWTIDYEQMDILANAVQPRLIIAGASRYSRKIDFERFRRAADRVGAILMVDMAHISGMVAAGVFQSPFEHADVVTSTTHKTLRGPRSGLIFYRKDRIADAAKRIHAAVYPGLQGGPHMNQIAAVAACLKDAMTPEFRQYQLQLLRNAKLIAERLSGLGYQPLTNGTDNHLVLLSLRNMVGRSGDAVVPIDGARVEIVGDRVGVLVNKLPPIKGDDTLPFGVRMGSAAMTTRGVKDADVAEVCSLIDRCVKLTVKLREAHGSVLRDGIVGEDGQRRQLQPSRRVTAVQLLADFKVYVMQDVEAQKQIAALKSDVLNFAHRFPVPY